MSKLLEFFEDLRNFAAVWYEALQVSRFFRGYAFAHRLYLKGSTAEELTLYAHGPLGDDNDKFEQGVQAFMRRYGVEDTRYGNL